MSGKTLLFRNSVCALLLTFPALLFFGVVHISLAVDYVPLAGIPGIPQGQAITSIPEYLNRIYMVLIVIGAVYAVVKIAIAGFKWAFSDIITDKSAAKKDIQGVLIGLFILLIPYIILTTIYPGLVSLDVIKNLETLKTAPTGGLGPVK